MVDRALRVVLAGGGTAGHVEPALALADALRRRHRDTEVTALGTERGLETRLVPARGYDLALIPAVPVPRRPGRDLLRLPGRLRAAVAAAEDVLTRTGADVLVGFGGYVAGPAYLAARRRRLPFVVHEANARPGLANRLGARFTPYVATATPGSALPHAQHLGIPLRREVTTLDRAGQRVAARAAFGLDADRAAAALLAAGVQVLHAAGAGHDVAVPRRPGEPPYVVLPYVDRMDLAYAAADLAVCRAGALTCAEVAAVGLPAAYVPLPVGNGEQRLNAAPVVAAGGGLLVDDAA
ncbi:MAG: UDP-N-acetylglucosamine--N-acetylmuramyl-(pentapeptide) pyrophosphoryl-undecaprenol N-acetylglucosamine transferase, partial [Actinomycetia bacterium]|nr:UDP-N-acetylglucosamine--N-acetylmuramyl-(pentapeptide) pyrophosphoryl-undecaprenol N-acetylglucosamine transferase [Actinomycetes bacterium]